MILYFLNFQKYKSDNLAKAKDENEKTEIKKEKYLIRRTFLRQLGFSLVVPFLKEKLKDGTGLHPYIREVIQDLLCLIKGEKSCPVDIQSSRSSSNVRSDDAGMRCRICFRSGKKRNTVGECNICGQGSCGEYRVFRCVECMKLNTKN